MLSGLLAAAGGAACCLGSGGFSRSRGPQLVGGLHRPAQQPHSECTRPALPPLIDPLLIWNAHTRTQPALQAPPSPQHQQENCHGAAAGPRCGTWRAGSCHRPCVSSALACCQSPTISHLPTGRASAWSPRHPRYLQSSPLVSRAAGNKHAQAHAWVKDCVASDSDRWPHNCGCGHSCCCGHTDLLHPARASSTARSTKATSLRRAIHP